MPAGVPADVCKLFEQMTFSVLRSGFDKYSARAVMHRMRWHEHVEKGNREFKFNNNWTPYLARWFEAKHPEYNGFFEKRRVRG